MPDSFHEVTRDGETIWIHDSETIWIVHYDEHTSADGYIRPAYYQAYQAIGKRRKGAEPWAVDNKRMSEHGWPTLEEAMRAVS